MCGINGCFAYSPEACRIDEPSALRVRDHMVARGPDAAGLWVSADRRIVLGHRRLSIIDLREDANQPMAIEEGRLTITYNGEIYNYRELRTELESRGRCFRTNSDTEVILHLFAEFGEQMLPKLRGMFALAIWDSQARSLFLACDAFGIKPLYVADNGHMIRFASQVKALLAGGSIDTAPDPAGHSGFLLWGHVPEPFTLYRGIRQLPAGSYANVDERGMSSPTTYSSPQSWFAQKSNGKVDLREALLDTVAHHFVADVPVSVFLSAGRDSTTLLALASESRQEPIHAVTLAFPSYAGTSDDEAPLASQVAGQYGAKHTVRELSHGEFHADLNAAMEAMDQPSVDGFNTFFVSKAASMDGTMRVALSGLGADEIFGGYPSFRQVPTLSRTLAPTRLAPNFFTSVNRLASRTPVMRNSPKFASLLEYGGTLEGAFLLRRALYLPSEIMTMLDPDFAAQGLDTLAVIDRLRSITQGIRSAHAKVSALEMTVYMRDRLLRDSDWAGMAHSLEIRVPFVDTELIRRIGPAIASSTPPTKGDMARTPTHKLPDAVLNKPKSGFTIPLKAWTHEVCAAEHRGDPHRAWALHVYTKQALGSMLVAGVSGN